MVVIILFGLAGYLLLNIVFVGPQVYYGPAHQISPTSQSLLIGAGSLANIEYYSSAVGGRVKLAKGTYLLKPPAGESQADYIVTLDTDHIAFGDVNNDGQEDAVAILTTRSGGTGKSVELEVVLNKAGFASNVSSKYLGDRTLINSLTIKSGVISIDMTPWDGGTGAKQTISYKLSGDKLVEI